MTLALIAAFVAAACYGGASILQALPARRRDASVLAVTRSAPYLIGVSLDVVAFLVSTLALRRLPLFSVQAIIASSVVVTALLAGPVLSVRLRRSEALAVATVCLGLILLGLSASDSQPGPTPDWLPLAALGSAALVGAVGIPATRKEHPPVPLPVLAGLAFGLLGLSVRLLAVPSSFLGWLSDPALYALVLSGFLALYLYAAALQRTQVTNATAVVVALDALVPATIGLAFLGDAAAPGRSGLALLGFVAAVGGAIALSRYGGELPAPEPVPEPAR
jgi:drug/metabolite transporter (DMT)-like permease